MQEHEQDQPILVVQKGIPNLKVIPLKESKTYIFGTSSKADIVLSNQFVSREHAAINGKSGRFQIVDLKSKNGTYVNNQRITPRTPYDLANGDRIEFTKGIVELVFVNSSETATYPASDRASLRTPGAFFVDEKRREVWMGGDRSSTHLSVKDFDILNLLYRHAGEACSKEQISRAGWPERSREGDAASNEEIEQYISRLRRSLDLRPPEPPYIQTIRGFGYKLVL